MTPKNYFPKRIKGLDFLRGIAILLVLCRHGLSDNILFQIGWIGVDLFFVLSGFLVTGLIIREYQKNKKINVKRFLIRRGFKIYPAFYFFIFTSIIAKFILKKEWYDWKKILAEVFYLQSYFPRMWGHTWSLAIEEHFYIIIAFSSYWLVKKQKFEQYKLISSILIACLFISLLLRLWISYPHIDNDSFSFFGTHLRMDGIVIGILCAIAYYYTTFLRFFEKNKFQFCGLAIILISPSFFFDGGTFIINTIGFTSINLGFGILLFLALSQHHFTLFSNLFILQKIHLAICFIGIHSYSIYLWHLFVMTFLASFIFPIPILLFFTATIGVGVLLSYLIEKPFLKLRDTYFGQK